eukprot:GFYU01001973.1.p1 GENE.GFYU01001973.1~~GFYU01001973.1.p1  ORF type:complete len:410 (-),score=112.04 GFYU01001973.1:55-1284(-)
MASSMSLHTASSDTLGPQRGKRARVSFTDDSDSYKKTTTTTESGYTVTYFGDTQPTDDKPAVPQLRMLRTLYGMQINGARRQAKARKELLEGNAVLWETAKADYIANSEPHEVDDMCRLPRDGGESSCVDVRVVDIQRRTPMDKVGQKIVQKSRFNHVVQMDGLLTPSQCKMLISATNKAQFLNAKQLLQLELPEEYTTALSDRKNSAGMMMVEDVSLAEHLWSRVRDVVQTHFPSLQYKALWSKGSLSQDPLTVHAVGVCPLMRVLKYQPGQQFAGHQDSTDTTDVVGVDRRKGRFHSFVTLAIYLNPQGEEFDGGSLRFIEIPKLVERTEEELANLPEGSSPLKKVYDPLDPPLEISPGTGRAMLFQDDEWHTGLPVVRGAKYMIQTSILYEYPEDDGEDDEEECMC